MGKIGDLIVRLKLKHEDYKKGLKQAEKDTQGFAGTLGKIKGAGLAVWAAVGAGAIKLGQDLVRATNQAEDAWAMFTTKAKSAWSTFVKSLLNGEWDNFMQRFKEDMAAAQILQEALDADTEIANSIALKKAAYAEELAKLEIIARDTTKSDKERLAAAEQYKSIIKDIYDQELERSLLLRKAQYQSFIPGKSEELFTEDVMHMLDRALMLYGETKKFAELGNRTFSEAVDIAFVNTVKNPYSEALKDKNNYGKEISISDADLKAWSTQQSLQVELAKLVKNQMSAIGIDLAGIPVQDWLHSFFKGYETNKNGDEVAALIASIIDVEKAKAAFDEITKKMQVLTERLGKDAADVASEIVDIATPLEKVFSPISFAETSLPDIIPDDWLERNREKIDAALAEAQRLQDITNEINTAFQDAIVSSLSGATEAFVNTVMGIEGADASQVMAAFLEPFAATAKSLGELLVAEGIAIELAKKTFENPLAGGGAMIAAGVSLIAIGSALSAGIQAIGRGTSASTSSYESSASSSDNMQRYEQEITVHVVGEISGDKIVLAGQKTLNKWSR